MYVVTYSSKKKVQTIRNATNIDVKRMEDFIQKDVIPTITQWTSYAPHKSKYKYKATLPDGLWLLHLLDYLQRK